MSEAKGVLACFKTSDGHQFDTEEEAEKHKAVLDAKTALEQAQWALSRALGQAQFTADGVPFDFGTFREYWYVRNDFIGLPALERIAIYRWNANLTDDDAVCVRVRIGDRDFTFNIAHLYATEHAAKGALLAASEARLAEYAKQVEKLRAEVNRGR